MTTPPSPSQPSSDPPDSKSTAADAEGKPDSLESSSSHSPVSPTPASPAPATPSPNPTAPNPTSPTPASPVAQAYSANTREGEIAVSQLHELQVSDIVATPRRRRLVPLLLFLATCLSTFWVGAAKFQPLETWSTLGTDRFANFFHWQSGMAYMVSVLAILLAHEMGHFLFTIRYKIPASYPIFIPIPFNAIGTMGAVIGMDGLKANRKQLFDLALAGPVAGLVVAIPILFVGIGQLDLNSAAVGTKFYNPILIRWIYGWLHENQPEAMYVHISQLNPYFMAGWVGLLITGLNMLPISQLDGGHVTYALFGKRARTIARGFLVVAIIFVIGAGSIWTLMLVLVILMGVDHPPTSDDTVELNEFRWRIGVLSLAIPILCFPIHGIEL